MIKKIYEYGTKAMQYLNKTSRAQKIAIIGTIAIGSVYTGTVAQEISYRANKTQNEYEIQALEGRQQKRWSDFENKINKLDQDLTKQLKDMKKFDKWLDQKVAELPK